MDKRMNDNLMEDYEQEKSFGELDLVDDYMFDVVTEDENGYVFYEVKFREKPLTEKMMQEEISQIKMTGIDCYKYVFISRSGFASNETDMIKQIKLKELYI